jgi:hypothetical protein
MQKHWEKELQDYWDRQDEKKEEIHLIEIEYKVRKFITELIKDARYTFRHEADSFEEGEQQLRDKWLD